MAYVATRERALLLQAQFPANSRSWEWDGTSWTRGPETIGMDAAISDGAMVYDRLRDQVLLYSWGAGLLLKWSENGWTWGPPLADAPALDRCVLAYDSTRDSVIALGWQYLQSRSETWEWDGSTWSLIVASPSAAPMMGASIAYDAPRARTVAFGTDGTWEFDGTSWTHLMPADEPAAREEHSMVYDPASGKVVLFGGRDQETYFDDTWEWDGRNWTERSSVRRPSGRSRHVMDYDSARGRVVMFGGFNTHWIGSTPQLVRLSDTWEWDGTDWSLRLEVPPPMANHAMAYDAARSEVVLYGAGETWAWDGVTWKQREAATSPVGDPGYAVAYSMTYDSSRERVVRVALSGATSEWDGTSWTDLPAPAPDGGYIAYDSLRGVLLLFGATTARTWEWDGATWTERTPQISPPPCGSCAMAYDSSRGQMLLVADGGGAGMSSTWLWDGMAWTQANPTQSPMGQVGPGLAYDAARDKFVSVASWRGFGGVAEWDGSNWQTGGVLGGVSRTHTAMAYDSKRRVLVLFGGRDASLSVQPLLMDTWETVQTETACTSSSQCATGSCVDGVCCATEASSCGPCRRCDVPGSVGTCAPSDGEPCDDGNGCTRSESCRGGECVPQQMVECPAPSECIETSACDPVTGACVPQYLPDRTPCNSDGGQCSNGLCVNNPCEGAADGTACSDSAHPNGGVCLDGYCASPCSRENCNVSPCERFVRCENNACIIENLPNGTPCPIGVCSDGDCNLDPCAGVACEGSAVCEPTTGSCSDGAIDAGPATDAGGSDSGLPFDAGTTDSGAAGSGEAGGGGTGAAGAGAPAAGTRGSHHPSAGGRTSHGHHPHPFRPRAWSCSAGLATDGNAWPLGVGLILVACRRRRARTGVRAAGR